MSYPPRTVATPADLEQTVLGRITDALYARMDAMNNEDNERLWNVTKKGALVVNNALIIPTFGIQQGPEQTVDMIHPFIIKIVTFYVEFRFQFIENLDSLVTFQYYLGKLQARLFGTPDNITIGGLAIDVQEQTSNPEIESDVDPLPGGTLTFQVTYRHYNGDPYHLPRETAVYPYNPGP